MGFWITFCVLASLGAGLRYGANGLQLKYLSEFTSFPLSTLLVNCAGSLLIGYLFALPSGSIKLFHPVAVSLVAVALLGSLTTFSGFAFETMKLFQSGQYGYASLNIFLNNTLCIGFCWLGFRWLH